VYWAGCRSFELLPGCSVVVIFPIRRLRRHFFNARIPLQETTMVAYDWKELKGRAAENISTVPVTAAWYSFALL
jgi:hypothetical protein